MLVRKAGLTRLQSERKRGRDIYYGGTEIADAGKDETRRNRIEMTKETEEMSTRCEDWGAHEV